jgi:hypothetical protein
MTHQSTTPHPPPARVAKAGWLVPTGLILLAAVPVIAGAVRLTKLTGGMAVTPEDARFSVMPLPVVLHIAVVTLYSVLGAFQFAPGFRRRRPGWHRAAGRVLIPSGLLVALTAIWMTLFSARPASDGDLLAAFRLVFGTAMLAFVVLGLAAIRRRDFAAHRAWMIRGYAVAMGAGTQAVTQAPWILVTGSLGGTPKALMMALAWTINLAAAEWIIRRRPAGPVR